MAVITTTASGDPAVGATWVGGVAPGTTDDAIVANTHNITLTGDFLVGSMEIQAGGTITGAGFTLTLDDENGAGNAFDNDGTISGIINLNITTPATTALDLIGTGLVNNINCNSSNSVLFLTGNSEISGNLTISSGLFGPQAANLAGSFTVGGNVVIENGSTIGHASWTGNLIVAGSVYNAGIWLADTSVATVTGSIYGPGVFPTTVENVNNIYNMKNVIMEWGIWSDAYNHRIKEGNVDGS